MTRLCVKNLPKSIDEGRLRKHFGSTGGEVTDVKLLKTKDGKMRRMAFIGYKTDAEAQEARSYFHGSFLDTSKLIVEEAKARGDAELARPWSKYSEGSSKHKTLVEKKGRGKAEEHEVVVVERRRRPREEKKEGGAEADGDVMEMDGQGSDDDEEDGRRKKRKAVVDKEEFLAAMMPRSTVKAWANDDFMAVDDEEEGGGKGKKKKQAQQQQQVKKGQSASAAGKTAEEASSEDEESGSEEEDEEEEQQRPKSVGKKKKEEVKPAEPEVSGLDYLRSKMKKGLEEEVQKEEEELGEEEEEEEDGEEAADEREKEEGGEGEEGGVEETARLFIRNLPFTTTEEELQEELERCGRGQVSEVHMPLDDAKRRKGYAFAQFLLPEDAKRAMGALNGQFFQGRILHVVPAKEPPKDALAELDPSQARTYKEKKEIERRKRAGDDRGWNSSFLRSKTVVDAVADRLGVEKGAVLDRESGSSMAVRLAVGETTLLAENRDFFEKEGVDLRALEGASQGTKASSRSKTTLLVKNLPYTTTEEDLTKLFGRFGSLSRVLLPPSRSIGLVDFLEPSEARRAFKGLAYKRFQHVPLYLEWAPLGVIKPPSSSSAPASAATAPATTEAIEAKASEDDVENEGPEASFTLFVKNLNFNTTEAALRSLFEKKTKGVRAVAIPKKIAPPAKGKKDGQQQQLSMGFGFVEYGSTQAAKDAIKALKGVVLDGHTLECKISNKRLTEAPSAKALAKNKRTKLVVRNVAFQATVKELKELFGTFGKVKTARIPKKFDGSHRGFAFVEFVTAKEAAQAFESLSATHLYGRHLVIEWAEDKDDIETLRDKAGKDAARAKMSAVQAASRGDDTMFD